jgi:hypothetical protein
VTTPSPMSDSQDEVFTDDGVVLTETEVQLLELYETMSGEDQAALTRIAQFLEAHPQDGPMTKEKWEELFFSAKSLQ